MASRALDNKFKLNDYMSVKEPRFGAKGDGSNDDTAEIQAAIAALSAAGGGTLYFPPGTYLISASLVFESNIIFQGAGGADSVIKGDGVVDVLMDDGSATSLTDIGIFDLGFDFNGYNAADFATAINFNINTCRRIRICRNRIFDSNYPGDGTVKQRQGIVVLPAQDCWILDNDLAHGARIKFGRGGASSGGIGAKNVWCQRNKLDYINDNGITFVLNGTAASPTGATTERVWVTDNFVYNPITSGIFCGSDGTSDNDPTNHVYDVHIARNTVIGDWATAGIVCTLPSGDTKRLKIEDNIIYKNADSGSTRQGIRIARASSPSGTIEQVSISRNFIKGSAGIGQAGIFLGCAMNDSIVRDNNVDGFDAGIWMQNAVTFTRTTIRGNKLRSTKGIQISNADAGPTLTGCIIQDNEVVGQTTGILWRSQEQSTAVIKGNTITGNTTGINFSTTGTPPAGGYTIDLIDNDLSGNTTTLTLTSGSTFSSANVSRGNKGLDSPASTVTTNVGNVGGGTDDLMSVSLTANRLCGIGRGVRVTAWGTTANNSNPKTVAMLFGGTTIATQALTISEAGFWRIVAEVVSTGIDTQDWASQILAGPTSINKPSSGTATINDGAAITVKCTGTVTDGGGGINNDDIVQQGMIVQALN